MRFSTNIQPSKKLTMSDVPKYNFPNAQKVQIFEQIDTYIENNSAISSEEKEAIAKLSKLIADIQEKHQTTSLKQQPVIIDVEFEEMQPRQRKALIDLLSIVFSGGVEAAKVFFPLVGIPIEVGLKLYEIYQKNRQNLAKGQ